jgi:hypothetical protein
MLKTPAVKPEPMRSRATTMTSVSSFSTTPRQNSDVLPTQCYICSSKISSASHHAPVLQLCDCRVAMCESCAVERVCCNDEFTLDCSICGNKVAPSANGIIRNVEKVKDSIDGYLERAFKFFKLPVAARGSTSFYAFQPLIAKFNKIDNLAPFVREYYASPSSGEGEEDGETSVIVRKKQSISALKQKLARMEFLRAGPLPNEVAESHVGSGVLPLGPLKHLQLTKDTYLEKLLAFADGAKAEAKAAIPHHVGEGEKPKEEEPITPACFTCHSRIHEGDSIQVSCDCDMLLCRSCAMNEFLSSKNTYRKGLTCPCCNKVSMISFDNIEKAKEEELSIIETMVRQYSTAEKKYSSKSIGDLRKLLAFLCSSSTTVPASTKEKFNTEFIHSLSFHQVQLELVRLYVLLERKKTKHGKIVLKSLEKKHKIKKANSKVETGFDEEEMKGGKKAKKAGSGKGDAEAALDDIKYYENTEDQDYFYEDSERDRGFDMPIGPLRLLHFRTNPYVELYLSHTHAPFSLTSFNEDPDHEDTDDEGDEHEEFDKLCLEVNQVWRAGNDRHRFDQFKPKHNTPCCKCSINPQNMDYIQMHLRTEHSITRRDEIEKFMKQIQITPVVGGEEKKNLLSSKSTDTDVDHHSVPSVFVSFLLVSLFLSYSFHLSFLLFLFFLCFLQTKSMEQVKSPKRVNRKIKA